MFVLSSKSVKNSKVNGNRRFGGVLLVFGVVGVAVAVMFAFYSFSYYYQLILNY